MALLRRVTDEKDTAMRRADERLEQTERRISDIYNQAASEMRENLNAYLSRFREKDDEYRQRVLDGSMSEDDYIRWRQNTILRTSEMQKQIENLSIGMTRVDELAVAAIRGDMPYIYTDAYNFGGYRGEMLAQAAGYNYDAFAIYNTDAIRIIAAEDPDLIPWDDPELNENKDLHWNRTHIQNAIAQGIIQGESIPHIADRLMPIVNMDRNAAVRTARTSYTSVQNQGRRDATARVKAAGIPMTEPWMSVLATNTRDTHLLLHGTLPNKDDKYGEGIIPSGNLLRFPADPLGDPEQVYNCQCRVQSYIEGIDHSHDDELYAEFMQENYYDDWLEVKDYKAADRAAALERQRQLLNGEVENREARIYQNRVAREQGAQTAEPATPVKTYRTASNRAEAIDILTDLGFSNISKNIKNIPDDLLIMNTNRISELNEQFGALGSGMSLSSKKMKAIATTVCEINYDDGTDEWGFILGNTFNNTEGMIKTISESVSAFEFMPCSENNYSIYAITHEYGHMVQLRMMYDDTFINQLHSNAGNVDVLEELYHSRQSIPFEQRQEIRNIARELNPNFYRDISLYGCSNDMEFFAECFANAFCDNPNEYGTAMRIWLQQKGFNI